MAKKKQPKVLRAGGRHFEVYNEGLCVYLHDAGNTEKLRQLIAKKSDDGETFYDHLSNASFAKDVAKRSVAVAYELCQDDEVFVEVHVGAPLTASELAKARWWPVQRAKLALPTGQLRIDTPNTMPLDLEDHEDEPALVSIPSGDYVLYLYRVDWKTCEADEVKYTGPQEILVFTPAAAAEAVPKGPPILEYPTPVEDTTWQGTFTIDGKRFTCQVNFWDYWEWIRLNLEPSAAQQLGLECGHVLRLSAAGAEFDMIYLDDLSREDFLTRQGGKESFEEQFSSRPEVAMGGWQEMDGRRVLAFYRFKASKSVPVKYHEKWTPASGVVLEEAYPLPAPVRLDKATVKDGVVHATVALANDELMVINAVAADVAELGSCFKLKLPHGIHTVSFGDHDRHSFNCFLAGKQIPSGLHYLRAMGLRCYARKGKVPKKAEEYNVVELPVAERLPVTGFFPPQTKDSLSQFLHIRQMYVDGSYKGFDWPQPPAAGAMVMLTKS